jgi:hypothetical protein
VKTYIFFVCNPKLLPIHHHRLIQREAVVDESQLLEMALRDPEYYEDYFEFSDTDL